jgi:two-component system, NarL family, response regulator LiaR
MRPEQSIVVLTGFAEEDCLLQSIQAGALGYLRKDVQPEQLACSIRKACAGEASINPRVAWKAVRAMALAGTHTPKAADLTQQELEILRLLAIGKTDREIARELFLSLATIQTHVRRILLKLGLCSRVQAALYSYKSGLVSIHETSNEALPR